MPFNAGTYRANRWRKDAWKRLDEARDIKARASRGEAYEWEIPRIALNVTLARSSMKLYLSQRRVNDLD